jgi:hypothetical protein
MSARNVVVYCGSEGLYVRCHNCNQISKPIGENFTCFDCWTYVPLPKLSDLNFSPMCESILINDRTHQLSECAIFQHRIASDLCKYEINFDTKKIDILNLYLFDELSVIVVDYCQPTESEINFFVRMSKIVDNEIKKGNKCSRDILLEQYAGNIIESGIKIIKK